MKVTKSTVESNVTSLPEITSFKSAGYQTALIKERGAVIARFVIENCPSFLDSKGIPDEIRNELKDGFALRWQELNPAVMYTADWIPSKDGKNGMHNATLAYCMSFTQQAFGAIDDPVKKGIIKKIRDDFSTYVSNRIGDIKKAIRDLDKTSKPKVPPSEFYDYMSNKEKGIWVTVKARRKTAEARGDTTAPTELALRMAIDAFNDAIAKNSK
jgi:hypothetical protein